MRLTHALRATLPPGATTGDARAELAGIVTDLYSRLARHRIALKLVDRCAPSYPTSPRFGSAPAGTPKSMRSRHT